MKLYKLVIFLLYSFLFFTQINFASSNNLIEKTVSTDFKLNTSDITTLNSEQSQVNQNKTSANTVVFILALIIFFLVVAVIILILKLSRKKTIEDSLNEIIINLEKDKINHLDKIRNLENAKQEQDESFRRIEKEKLKQIEEINQLNKSLNDTEFLLNDINTKKDKFLSIMSQDLKAPLNSLVGFTELFITEIDNVDKSKIKDLAYHFRKSIKNLSNLLENLLEWSRMQMGVKYFHPCKIDIEALIEKNINLLKDQAIQKKIEISFKSNGQFFVLADVNMFNSVIKHLISNAIKFSHKESKIDVSYLNNEGVCEVIVKDYGIGLDEYSLEKVFKIDKHFTKEGTNREKGTGLGLILCKEFVEKNKGKIWLNSSLGKGTDAHFTVKVFPK